MPGAETWAALLAAAAVGTAAPRPPQVMADTFKACRWGEVDGRALTIWSYACPKAAGDVRLVADDRAGGFALASASSAGAGGRVVLRTFAKPAAAPVEAVLPQVLRATGAHRASCRLVEHAAYGDWGRAWLLEPTGAEKTAYDAANAREPQPNPCGALGIGPAGDRFFRPLAGDPTRVVYADMGSEIQVFDLRTLAPR